MAAINAANGTIGATYANQLATKLNDSFSTVVGTQLQNAPKYSATLAYQHEFEMGMAGQLTPRVEAAYKDKYWAVGELGVPGAPTLSAVLADHTVFTGSRLT